MKEKNPKYRILLVVPFTLPTYSGSGINAFHFARFLNRNGEFSTLLTFNRNLKLKSIEIIDGVPIRRIPYFNRNLLTKILSMFIIFPGYLTHILKHDIILIYGAHVIGYQLLVSFGKLFGRKVIFRSLMMGVDDLDTMINSKPVISRPGIRALFNRLSLYFAINPVFEEKYRRQIRKQPKILVSPQGFDPEYFYTAAVEDYEKIRQIRRIDNDCFVILSVGFIIPRKGYTEIFDALADLDFNFRYYMVGEYDFGTDHFLAESSEEASQIKEYGEKLLGDKLYFEGPQNKLLDYYRMADIVLFNSSQEGLSNALLESMACGKPVLAREIPGLRDYIIWHEKSGLLFQHTLDMNSWLRKLHDDPEFAGKLATRAADFISKEANFSIVWRRLIEELYTEPNG